MSCITLVRSIASIFCLFAAAAWTVPAVAAVEGNPQVALSLNQAGFVAGEVLTLTVTIQRGTQNNTVDGWIWVRIPGGGLFYLEPDFTGFTGAPGPVVRNLTAVDFSAPVFQFPVPGFLLPGTYTFFAAGAAPGLDPFIDGNRITNLAAVEVTLQGPPTPVVDWRSEILYFALTDPTAIQATTTATTTALAMRPILLTLSAGTAIGATIFSPLSRTSGAWRSSKPW